MALRALHFAICSMSVKRDMFLFNCSLSGVCALYLERMTKVVGGGNGRLKTGGLDT